MITWFSIRPAPGDSAPEAPSHGPSGSLPRTTCRTKELAAHGAARIRNGVAIIVRIVIASRYWYPAKVTRFSRAPWERRRKENSPICANPTAVMTVDRHG